MAEGDVAGTRVYRAGIYMVVLQQQIQTSFHVRDVGLTNEDPSDVIEELDEFVNENFKTILPAAARITRIDAQEITSKAYAQKEYNNLPGTYVGGIGTSTTAALVSLRSAQRARTKNGRMFWPALGAQAVSNGLLEASTLGAIQSVVDNFASRFTGNALTHDLRAVVVSPGKPADAPAPAVPASWIDVEVVKLSNIATNVRRRKIGVGS